MNRQFCIQLFILCLILQPPEAIKYQKSMVMPTSQKRRKDKQSLPQASFIPSASCLYQNIILILITSYRTNIMPVIKPISDLRNKSSEISRLAHATDEPIFITRNGEGDMVVMSLTHYAKMKKKLELLHKLSVAQAHRAAGDGGKPLAQVVREIRKRLRASA